MRGLMNRQPRSYRRSRHRPGNLLLRLSITPGQRLLSTPPAKTIALSGANRRVALATGFSPTRKAIHGLTGTSTASRSSAAMRATLRVSRRLVGADGIRRPAEGSRPVRITIARWPVAARSSGRPPRRRVRQMGFLTASKVLPHVDGSMATRTEDRGNRIRFARHVKHFSVLGLGLPTDTPTNDLELR